MEAADAEEESDQFMLLPDDKDEAYHEVSIFGPDAQDSGMEAQDGIRSFSPVVDEIEVSFADLLALPRKNDASGCLYAGPDRTRLRNLRQSSQPARSVPWTGSGHVSPSIMPLTPTYGDSRWEGWHRKVHGCHSPLLVSFHHNVTVRPTQRSSCDVIGTWRNATYLTSRMGSSTFG